MVDPPSPNIRVVKASIIVTILGCRIFFHDLTAFMALSSVKRNPVDCERSLVARRKRCLTLYSSEAIDVAVSIRSGFPYPRRILENALSILRILIKLNRL